MNNILEKISKEAFIDELKKIADGNENYEAKKIDDKIIEEELSLFLKSKEDVKDEEVHTWAENKKYDIKQVEKAAYKIAKQYINVVNEGKGPEAKKTWKDVDQDQLKMGIKVEMEHTKDPDLARKIATDHLTEFPNYYTALDKMETELKNKKD